MDTFPTYFRAVWLSSKKNKCIYYNKKYYDEILNLTCVTLFLKKINAYDFGGEMSAFSFGGEMSVF